MTAAASTRATAALTKADIDYETAEYPVDKERTHFSYADQVVEALDVSPKVVFKTLVCDVDGHPCLALVPADAQLDLKALAHSVGGSKATLVEPTVAQRLTGYVVGGISPIATKKHLPVVADESMQDRKKVYVSAGKRGLQLRLRPSDLLRITKGRLAPIARRRS